MSQCVYLPHLSAHSSVDGHLGCIHSLAVVDNAARNTGLRVPLESTKVLLCPQGKYLALQIWNRRLALFLTFLKIFFMIVTQREAETQAEGEAGSMHCESDMRFHPGSPGSRHGPKAGAKRLSHPGIPYFQLLEDPSQCFPQCLHLFICPTGV